MYCSRSFRYDDIFREHNEREKRAHVCVCFVFIQFHCALITAGRIANRPVSFWLKRICLEGENNVTVLLIQPLIIRISVNQN